MSEEAAVFSFHIDTVAMFMFILLVLCLQLFMSCRRRCVKSQGHCQSHSIYMSNKERTMKLYPWLRMYSNVIHLLCGTFSVCLKTVILECVLATSTRSMLSNTGWSLNDKKSMGSLKNQWKSGSFQHNISPWFYHLNGKVKQIWKSLLNNAFHIRHNKETVFGDL